MGAQATRGTVRVILACAAAAAVGLFLLVRPAAAVDVTVPTLPPVPTTLPEADELPVVDELPVPITVPPVALPVPVPVPIPGSTTTNGADVVEPEPAPAPALPPPADTPPSATAAVATPAAPPELPPAATLSTGSRGDDPVTLAAAARRATVPFAVPLLAMGAVLAYLVVRGALDRRDARFAAVVADDRWVGFR